MSVQSGDRIGRYLLGDLLGEGGMGRVFQAFDDRLRRRVAIKVMHDDDDDASVLREARAAATLHHPHVVAIYDVLDPADAGGVGVIVMELVEGTALRDEMKRAPQGERLSWLRQCADALAGAHDRGLVHRDFKPENVMITADRRTVKLLDFGIAKTSGVGAPAHGGPLGLTASLAGTPRYMSPEQAAGTRVDARTDVFAWGVVAFEVLTGRHPNDLAGLSAAEATTRPTAGVVKPISAPETELVAAADAAGLSDAVRETLLAAMRPSLADRTQTMSEIVAALGEPARDAATAPVDVSPGATTGPASPAPVPAGTRPSRRRGWTIAAVVASVAGGTVALVGLGTSNETPHTIVLDAPVAIACSVGPAQRIDAPWWYIFADPAGTVGMVGSADGSPDAPVRLQRASATLEDATLPGPAPIASSWLGRVDSAQMLFVENAPALVTWEPGLGARAPQHRGGRFLRDYSVKALASSATTSFGVLARPGDAGTPELAVMSLAMQCGLMAAIPITTGTGIVRADAAADRLAVLLVRPEAPSIVTLIDTTPTPSHPCALRVVQQWELAPMRGGRVALVAGTPWVISAVLTHEIMVWNAGVDHLITTPELVFDEPFVVASGATPVAAWEEVPPKGRARIQIAPFTAGAGFGSPVTVAEHLDGDLLDVVSGPDHALLLRRDGATRYLHTITCR